MVRYTRSSKVSTRSSKVSKTTKSASRKKSKKVVTDDEETVFHAEANNQLDLSENDSAAEEHATSSKQVAKKGGRKKSANTITSQSAEDLNTNRQEETDANNDANNKSTVFRSRFPGFELDTFEDFLGDWTLVGLRQAIAKQGSTLNRASQEINALVKTIRIQYEKRMLMAALMGGVPEAVIWNIVGEGAKKGNANSWIRFLGFCFLALQEKLPAQADRDDWGNRNKKLAKIWKELSDDERTVFKDPYFFALANLPDLTYVEHEGLEDQDDDLDMEHVEASTLPPKVHQLTEADRLKYQPIFNRIVDVAKLHVCYGRPDPTSSVESLQKKSLAELRKAHHDFSVVCQRYQVTYYLTAVSCGSYEGWAQTFSNNVSFAEWAEKDAKVPSKFSTYIHGKTVGKEIEGAKGQQPSDERKTRLGHQLNALVDAVYKGNIFPKKEDPEGEIKDKGWPIRIVQKEDIESKRFVIELIPEAERVAASNQKKSKRKKKLQPPAPNLPSSDNEQDEATQSQAQPNSHELNEHAQSRSPQEQEQQPLGFTARIERQRLGRSRKQIHNDSSESDNSIIENLTHKPEQQRPRLQMSRGSGDGHETGGRTNLDGSPIDNGLLSVLFL
ncbi:hypothetical protein DFH28DRAFT_1085265 [Melampsora americana]|nr:hypothetical protein DFH28DRAFT_1085265 [Melampsora americana]